MHCSNRCYNTLVICKPGPHGAWDSGAIVPCFELSIVHSVLWNSGAFNPTSKVAGVILHLTARV